MKSINYILLIYSMVLLTACKNQVPKTSDMDKNTDAMSSLQDILDEKKLVWEQKAPENIKRIYAEGIEAVSQSGVLEKAINLGDVAPDFLLTNAIGHTISLQSALEKGPVVLTWYRGGWCPYCNLTLQNLQKILPSIKSEGASLIALTPEMPDKSMSTKEKHQLQFEVLSDEGNKTGKEYGIVFKLTSDVAENYQSAFDLHGYNNDKSDELPLAATYVIDTKGFVRYAFLNSDYRKRAEPHEIIEALKKLKSEL